MIDLKTTLPPLMAALSDIGDHINDTGLISVRVDMDPTRITLQFMTEAQATGAVAVLLGTEYLTVTSNHARTHHHTIGTLNGVTIDIVWVEWQ